MRGALGAVEPLDVSQTATNLALLNLLLGHLLLLLGLELELGVVLDTTGGGAVNGGAGGGAGNAAAGAAVLEAVEADGGGAALRNLAVLDEPLLGAEGADELFVVGNEDDTTLEVTDGDGQTTKGVTVQEVSRLVKDEQMGVVPHGTGDDDLDLLATGKGADLVVVGNLGVQAEILEVLRDDGGLELTVTQTLAGSLVIVEFLDKLAETLLDKVLSRQVGVVLGQQTTPFTVKRLDENSIKDGL